MVNKLVLNTMGVKLNNLSVVHFNGAIVAERKQENNALQEWHNNIDVKILFDTGALSANNISTFLVNDIKSWLPMDQIITQKNSISLADDSKIIESSELVILDIEVLSDIGENIVIREQFISINMQDNDIILGLPTILV